MGKQRGISFCLILTLALLWGFGRSGEAASSNYLKDALESTVALDLTNLNIYSEGDPFPQDDPKFMSLLRAKLRITYFLRLREVEYEEFPVSPIQDVSTFFQAMDVSGSANMAQEPFDFGDYILFQVILPLDLEALVRELPRYYDGVMSVKGWRKKFDIMSTEEYGPNLNGGRVFHLAGFPVINEKSIYMKSLSVEGKIHLNEYDSSIEGWLYSFWLRRYQDGSMETVKKILDWLNGELDQIEKAVG